MGVHDEGPAQDRAPAQAPAQEITQAQGEAPVGTRAMPRTGQHALLDLQRTAGNRAVASLLSVQRDPDPNGKEPIDRIHAILADRWVGPLGEAELEANWSVLGEEGAKAHPIPFGQSIERGMDANRLSGSSRVISDFKSSVTGIRDANLKGNLAALDAESKKVGLDKAKAERTVDEQVMMSELMLTAERARVLDEQVKGLAKVRVGSNISVKSRAGQDVEIEKRSPAYFEPGAPPHAGLEPGENGVPYAELMGKYEAGIGALMDVASENPAVFVAMTEGKLAELTPDATNPDKDPTLSLKLMLADTRAKIAETQEDPPDWDDLKPIHRQLLSGEKKSGRTDFSNNWNSAIVKAELNTEENLATAGDVAIGIAAALAMIFAEIATGGAATVFFLGAGVGISGANAARKWDKFGELKSASGSATSKDSQLVDKGQVDAAKIDAIIESLGVILDAIGIAIRGAKVVSATAGARKGAAAMAASTGLDALGKLGKLDAKAQADNVAQSIINHGVEKSQELSKLTPEQMSAKITAGSVHPMTPTNAQALQALSRWAELGGKGLDAAELPKALQSVLTTGKYTTAKGVDMVAEQVVTQAVDRMGMLRVIQEAKGWKALGAALAGTNIGEVFHRWRFGILQDLKAFIKTLGGKGETIDDMIKATGTFDNVTNDLDISLLGPKASERRIKAAEFLAGRTGLGGDAKTLDNMLYIGLFTDPNRIHLFDDFPQLQQKLAASTMKFEETLIWNDELYQAIVKRAGGDKHYEHVVEAIEQQMATLGVPNKAGKYAPLSAAQIEVLSTGQDALQQAAAAAAKAGDWATASKNVEQLANIQAQINVAEGGGYFSGGGVRKFVTDKEKFLGKRGATTGAHDYGAALDQLPKLRKSIKAFNNQVKLRAMGKGTEAELVSTVKDLAKYGDRFTQPASAMGKKMPGIGSDFAGLEANLKALVAEARAEKGVEVTFLAQVKANEAGAIAKVDNIVKQYDDMHIAILAELRRNAGIDGVPDLAEEIAIATRARYELLMFRDQFKAEISKAAQFAGRDLKLKKEAADAAEEASSGDDPTKPSPAPTPAP